MDYQNRSKITPLLGGEEEKAEFWNVVEESRLKKIKQQILSISGIAKLPSGRLLVLEDGSMSDASQMHPTDTGHNLGCL